VDIVPEVGCEIRVIVRYLQREEVEKAAKATHVVQKKVQKIQFC